MSETILARPNTLCFFAWPTVLSNAANGLVVVRDDGQFRVRIFDRGHQTETYFQKSRRSLVTNCLLSIWRQVGEATAQHSFDVLQPVAC